MTMTYPIIETQLRLVRALQKGYVEALEAGDWQAADYRCSQLHKLCEGLHYITAMLDKQSVSEAVPPRRVNGWVSSIRSTAPTPSPNRTDQLLAAGTFEPPPETQPDPMRYAWDGEPLPLGVKPKPVDEVW
jgi:hypothetical protein